MTRTPALILTRHLSRVALPVVVLIVLAACAGGPTGYAFVYDGTAHSQASVDKELRALAENEQFRTAVSDGTAGADNDNVLPAAVTAAWLNVLVQYATIDAAVADAGISVTDDDRLVAEQQAIQLFGNEQVWGEFPQWFRDRVIDREARKVALVRTSLAAPTEADLLAYFEENVATLCPSGLIVSHILVTDADAAQDIVDELDGGADFATLATERSTDTSGAAGGTLGCLAQGTFVAEFEAAALALEPGMYSGVVATDFGFHVIRVEVATFEALRDQITAAVGTASADAFTAEIDKRLEQADLKVNPRYGDIDSVDGITQIVAPPVPEVRREPEPAVPDVTVPLVPPQPAG